MGIPSTFRNYVLNPATAPSGGGAELRRNLIRNPIMEKGTTPGAVRTNEIRNPSFENNNVSFDWPIGPHGYARKDVTGRQSGANALKIVPTGASADSFVGSTEPRALTAVANGTSVTISATITLTSAQLGTDGLGGGLYRPRGLYLFTRPTTGSGAYTSAWETAPNAPGTYRLSATLPIATGTSPEFLFRLYNGSSNPADVVYWDDVLVQKTVQNAESTVYFDGSTETFDNDDATRTHGWTGAVHASTSNEYVYPVPTYTNTGVAICRWTAKRAYAGNTGCMGITYSGAGATLTAGPSTTVTLPAATQYTFSAYYYKPTGAADVALRASGPGMTTVTGTAVGTNDSWVRATVTFTTVTAGTYTLSMLNSGAVTLATPAGNTDAWQLETGAVATSFFSGATNAQNLSYKWSGTANASASVESGLAMPGFTASNSSVVGVQVAGTNYAGIIPNSASTDSKAYVDGGPGGLRMGLMPGKSYFIRGTLMQQAALAGSVGTVNYRNMTLYTKAGAAAVKEVRTTPSANVAGTYEHSMFVSIPADATEAYLSVNHGHSTGAGTAHWRNVMVTEASYGRVLSVIMDNADTTQFDALTNATLSSTTVGNVQWLTVTPTSSNVSYVRWAPGALLQPGRTYTLSWSIRRPAVLTGTMHANARRPVVILTTPGGSSTVLGTQAPNTAATDSYTLTFTTPTDLTSSEIQFWNGAAVSAGLVQYNTVKLTDDSATDFGNVYFDGNTGAVYPNRVNRWLGVPNFSQSEYLFRGLWIEANTTVSPPRLQFTAAGLGLNAVSQVTILRTAGNDSMAVAGWVNRNVLDIGVGVDWLVPLNTQVEYQLMVNGSQIDSEVVEFTNPCGWIADPLIPNAAMPVWTVPNGDALQLTNAALKEKAYSSGYEKESVIGGQWPLARAGQRTLLEGINVSVQAPANVTSDQFYQMVKNTPILCIRTHPSWGNVPPVIYVAANIVERPLNRHHGGQFTVWDITGDVVMPLSRGPVIAGVTHAEVQLALAGRTHQSIRDASSRKRWVDIIADPFSLGGNA